MKSNSAATSEAKGGCAGRSGLGGSGRASQTSGVRPEALLEWRVWLAARQPGKAIGALSIMLAGSFLVALSTASVVLGLVALVLLLLATRDFFLPARYRITEEGAAVEGFMSSHFIRWGKVRGCYVSAEGLKLSPLRRGSRMEPFRGVYLRFGANREEVVEMVKGLAKEGEER